VADRDWIATAPRSVVALLDAASPTIDRKLVR
jgi:hypothetical protein